VTRLDRGVPDSSAKHPIRRPRLEDVAARVGVSTATVSLVLRNAPGPSDETRRRVLAAAAELGYRTDRTASLLARRRAHLLGVMMDVRNPFHAELVGELHDAAERLGYDLVLSTLTASRDQNRAVETLVDSRCEALILLGPDSPAASITALSRQLPVVVIGRRMQAPSVDVVRTADDQGVGLAIEHLVGLGHREIAYVDGGKGAIASERRKGYRVAMRRHGLADLTRIVPGDHTEEAGTRAARLLLGEDRLPSAVVAFNDRCSLGILDAIKRAGLVVPADLSVVGYDDSPAAQLAHVNLTTVRQDVRLQAEHAVTAAAQRLDDGRGHPREVVLAPQLVVRGTTGPPPSRSTRHR
jgi:DNA-binding LacI/PurR family transcriptional regulator